MNEVEHCFTNYDFEELTGATALTETSHIQTTDNSISVVITTGETYNFKVQARNVVGYSADSDPVSIVASDVPDPPTMLSEN